MQELDKLHQSVIKGWSTPTVPQKKPSLDFSKDDPVQVSFLKGDNNMSSTPKQSTDYSDQWSTDLPSPLELLANADRETAEDYQANFDIHPATGSGLTKDQDFDTDPLQDIDPSDFDHDQNVVETALVGLSDSLIMQGHLDLPTKNSNSSDANYPLLPVLSMPSCTTEYFKDHKIQSSIPFKPSTEAAQDPEGASEDGEVGHAKRESKRQKPDNNVQADLANQPSSNNASTQQAPPTTVPVIKPGQPAWVYDFDPGFIAEYQDIVDFV